MHGRLLRSGRGQAKDPGEFRRSQNWLGGTRPGNAVYVPPPVDAMKNCLDDFEQFLRDESLAIPPLIKAGLLHVQFETIHPFLDGNGRLGRLLVALYLVDRKVLREPLLYLSLYLKRHRSDYYRLLQEVRGRGTWETWLEFFLDGVAQTANNAHDSALRIVNLFKTDRDRIAKLGDRTRSVLRLHDFLQTHPFVTATQVAKQTGLSMPTVNNGLEILEREGIIREVTGKRRGRVYAYSAFLEILDEGTDPDSNAV